MHCSDIATLPQYTPNNPHFLWADIQLGKGSFSIGCLATFTIGDPKEELYYRTCIICKGVKVWLYYTVTMKAKKINHVQNMHVKHELQPVTTCPVELIMLYLYPPNSRTDNRLWIGGIYIMEYA